MAVNWGTGIRRGYGRPRDIQILNKMSTSLATALPVCKRQSAGKLILAQ